jgi:hypothetical protein
MKTYFAKRTNEQRDEIVDFVRKKQKIEAQEKTDATELLQVIFEKNNKTIADQQERIATLTSAFNIEKKQEDERLTREEEEQKQKEDEARLQEVKRKIALDQEKNAILNKNKKRSTVSFSLLANPVIAKNNTM